VNAALALAVLAGLQYERPSLGVGDRVRVHIADQPSFLGMPLPRLRRTKYSGTLTEFSDGERLALQRDKWLFFYPAPEVVALDWIDIYRIDVPNGRDVAGGALQGVVMAFSVAIFYAGLCKAFGGHECDFWQPFAYSAAVTVPVGAAIGSQFTRWKAVYRRYR
jgi:hypothetical protein